MVLLHPFESLDLFLVKVFLLDGDVGDLRFAAVHGRLENIVHVPEGFSHVVMNPFENRGDVAVEVVEVGDELDEADIDEGVSAADDAAVDLFLDR